MGEIIYYLAYKLFFILKETQNNTDDAFFNRNWAGVCWDSWAGTGTAAGPDAALRSPAKTSNKEDQRGLVHCLSNA